MKEMRRLIEDESGMTMGLAVIMIVLIGVMGAGLLTFVQRDLEAVVEVNQGQKALEMADTGVQLAKQQLRLDVVRQHYDLVHTNDCTSGNRIGSDWSPATTGYPSANCTGTPASKAAGITKTFDGGSVTVTIQCFDQTGDTSDICQGITENAPESIEASKKTFFKVISTGYYPADGSGAKRKVEAIFNIADAGIPQAFYTPKTSEGAITVSGSTCIKNVSLFTLGGVNFNGQGGCNTGNGKSHVTGTDYAYRSWAESSNLAYSYPNDYNSTARTNDSSVLINASGAGAVKHINGGSLETRDFDTSTNPKFIKKDPPTDSQTSAQITFPFDYTTQQGDQDDEQMDFWLEEALRQEAETGQNHYMELSGSNPLLSTWPSPSSANTVVYVKLLNEGTTLKWNVSGTCNDNPPKKGILVVKGGNFTTQPNNALFSGAIIIRGGEVLAGEPPEGGILTALVTFVCKASLTPRTISR